MKAVILAAGKSTRAYPLTLTRPKPLLKVAGKTLLEHNLEQLKGIVDEAIIIVGYMKEMIMQEFGMDFKGIKLTYVVQKELIGTGRAIMEAKQFIDDDFIMMCGDDLYSAEDIRALAKKKNAALVYERETPEQFGVFFEEGGKAVDFKEKPKGLKKGLCNTGCYKFEKEVLGLVDNLKKSPRGEYEFVDVFFDLIKSEKLSLVRIKGFWLPLTYPWNLLDANSHFLDMIDDDIKGTIEKNVTIDGKLQLGENSVIMSGTYIEGNVIIGRDCRIGPNAYIRGPTTIGDCCRIGPAEIKASIFFDGCRCDHVSYVGDSVLGEKTHLGAHTVIANLRHDKQNHRSEVKGELIDTGRRKLGAILGDNCDTGVNTTFYPGRKMWPYTYTEPCEVVKKDIVDRVCKAKLDTSQEKG